MIRQIKKTPRDESWVNQGERRLVIKKDCTVKSYQHSAVGSFYILKRYITETRWKESDIESK
jgi:hypothetical protein